MTHEEAARILDPETSRKALVEYTGVNEDARMDAVSRDCRILAEALRSGTSCLAGEPLTLERLREMDGQPVFLPETNCGALVTKDIFVMLLTFPDGEKCSANDWYKQVGPVYAYPSAHIDMAAWKPCNYCANTMQNREVYKTEKYAGLCDFEVFLDCGEEIAVNAYNHQTPYTDEICFSFPVSYCPKCGRPLTEEALAALEKRLRG